MSDSLSLMRQRLHTPLTLRDVIVRVLVIVWLTFVWVLLWGTFSAANIIGGFAVAIVILVFLPLPQLPVEGRFHLLSAAALAVHVGFSLVLSSLWVAWLSIRPGPPPKSAVLRVHVHVKSELVLGLLIDAINIVPGTVVLDIVRHTGVLYIHVLDVGTSEKVDRFYTEVDKLQRMFITAFERDDDWRQRTHAPIMPPATSRDAAHPRRIAPQDPGDATIAADRETDGQGDNGNAADDGSTP